MSSFNQATGARFEVKASLRFRTNLLRRSTEDLKVKHQKNRRSYYWLPFEKLNFFVGSIDNGLFPKKPQRIDG